MYTYKARLVSVVDADTVDLEVDLGFGITYRKHFRLLGLDAPERFTPEGKVATAALTDILQREASYTIHTYKTTDKYGRYLADIIMFDGESATSKMIASGHGKVSRFAPPKE